jgi:hypothetical protein
MPVRRDRDVDEHERQPDIPDLAVELQQRVFSEGRRHDLEARDQRELEPHHRQPDEPERDGEVRHEVVVGLAPADQRERERSHHDTEIREHAEDASNRQRHFDRP